MRAAWFFSPVDVDAENDEINKNTGEFKPTEIMRAMYDELLGIALLLDLVRQGGDDDPNALAEPESAELRFAL